jgi:hypothetical protein
MALTRFGFIVTGDGFVQWVGTDRFRMKVVGVQKPEEGVQVAKDMVAEGIQLIELCGGFSPVWAGRIIDAAGIIKDWRNPFSDDFGLLMAAAPGCLMLLGTANPGKGISEIWHRPGFDVDEDALPVGVHIMALAAFDLLR